MKKISFLAFFLAVTLFGMAQIADNHKREKPTGPRVMIETNYGNIEVMLYDDTPLHRDNFLKLVKDHTYAGTLFHRVIPQFMIQGGDPDSRSAKPGQLLGSGNLGYRIPAEFRPNHFHVRGALCAAREGDAVNPNRESSSSQFYIVQGRVWDEQMLDLMQQQYGKQFSPEQRKAYTTVGGSPHLDGEYTVFGRVVRGMDVVDRIAQLRCDANNRPVEDVRIERMTLLQ